MQKTALICGVTGQDGSLLAGALLEKGYRVVGTSRDIDRSSKNNLEKLGIVGRLELASMALVDFRSVLTTLTRYEPNEVYNLAGQSSVGLSFEQPVETLESIAHSTLNLLEAVRYLGAPIRVYNASSSECFGDTGGLPANEKTPFYPRSPYAVAKCASHWQVVNYREAYGLFACNGILFNHESPLRGHRFVTQKIIQAALRISEGSSERLQLGDVSIARDWGWAPEYVDAMWRMLQLPDPSDFVIATGTSTTLERYCEKAFAQLGMDWRDHVDVSEGLKRPAEISINTGDATKARQLLNWSAVRNVDGVISGMLKNEL